MRTGTPDSSLHHSVATSRIKNFVDSVLMRMPCLTQSRPSLYQDKCKQYRCVLWVGRCTTASSCVRLNSERCCPVFRTGHIPSRPTSRWFREPAAKEQTARALYNSQLNVVCRAEPKAIEFCVTIVLSNRRVPPTAAWLYRTFD